MKKKKLIKRLLVGFLIVPILLITVLITILYIKQDSIVQNLLKTLNADFNGKIQIRDSHISPFANFPYISIDLDDLKVFETKSETQKPLLEMKDVYLGFDVITLLSGKIDIKMIKLADGKIHIIQRKNGEFNVMKAFETKKPIEDSEEEFHLALKSIQLQNVDITKINEENQLTVEAFIDKAQSKFKTSDDHLMIGLNSKLVLNVIKAGDTTFFKHKHVTINTKLDYYKKDEKLQIATSEIELEHAFFGFEGIVDFNKDMNVDLKFKGTKPNFDIFLAFAPEDLAPTLEKYDNKGEIYFDATVKGTIADGKMPKIEVNFGCKDAMLHNTVSDKKLDELNFKAYFTNGDSMKLSTMQFHLKDFTSRPEAGKFSGHLIVKNFETPEIETRIVSDFDLDFLSKFLNLKDVQGLKGKVKLTMNFKDIIDLNHPERAIEKLNESYFTELQVSGFGFKYAGFHLPVENVNIKATLKGHLASIEKFDFRMGKSDLSLTGTISDLPAIIHHTKDEVKAVINIKSKMFDIKELTSVDKKSKPIDEQIENLSLKFSFKSSARAFTESKNLPEGEFFIDDLYAKLKHYPHTLHDFHADLYIDSSDFRVVDFTGMIDKSDFHFNGKLQKYDIWMQEISKGDTKIEFNLNSNLLQLEDIFAYQGENYVPEDYRHEEIKGLKLHGNVALHFNKDIKSIDLALDHLTAQMKVHHCKFENFKGRIHYESEHLVIQDFSGKLGKSIFGINLNYYLGKDKAIKKRDNHFGIVAKHLDFDELFNYNPSPTAKTIQPAEHEKGFNIYDLPFTDMTFDLKIDHLNYHRYLLNNINGKMHTTENHYLYIDTLSFLAADGKFNISGYFNGSNKDLIYFSPNLKMEKVDLDKLFFKFENFGQDHMVSENVHGKLSGKISGKLHMHKDLVPIIDDSELHMDIEVTNGKLENYSPLTAMAEYFKDKNVSKVMFDTLKNHIDMNKGVMSFPLMTINSSLGFIEVSGKQDMNFNMDYLFKIPLKLVTSVARQKLFGKDKEEAVDPEKEDEIQYRDQTKKIKYVNLKLTGNTENYKISLGKK